MSSHFAVYPTSTPSKTPWKAQYEFPSYANKAVKIVPRIPPKNGSDFIPGNTIRLEFPAQGYVDPSNLTLSFDLKIMLKGTTTDINSNWSLRVQNNVLSTITRIRLLYGATPFEDLIDANQIVRNLTDWTTSNGGVDDQTSVALGIGGVTNIANTEDIWTLGNSRLFSHGIIHGLNGATNNGFNPLIVGTKVFPAGDASATDPFAIRRYQVQLPLGLFNQGKVIPVKWMASQLAVELTLAQPAQCLIFNPLLHCDPLSVSVAATGTPTFSIHNVVMIPEILEYDLSHDEQFLLGLQNGGVPIKISSWHTFTSQQGKQSQNNVAISEKSRYLKAIFAVVRPAIESVLDDSGATFGPLPGTTDTPITIDSYQFRIGGRYFPAAPVICSGWQSNANFINGACEAYTELQKCLKTLGDARLSTSVNARNWGMQAVPVIPSIRHPGYVQGVNGPSNIVTADYLYNWRPNLRSNFGPVGASLSSAPIGGACGLSSGVFCMSTNLETTASGEISGLNAQEQSDITLTIKYSGATNTEMMIQVFTYYDAILNLRENNAVELIE